MRECLCVALCIYVYYMLTVSMFTVCVWLPVRVVMLCVCLVVAKLPQTLEDVPQKTLSYMWKTDELVMAMVGGGRD